MKQGCSCESSRDMKLRYSSIYVCASYDCSVKTYIIDDRCHKIVSGQSVQNQRRQQLQWLSLRYQGAPSGAEEISNGFATAQLEQP